MIQRTVNRKDFLRTACNAACGIGLASVMFSAESCSPFPVVKTKNNNGKITVPIIQVTTQKNTIIRDTNLDYDIMVIQEGNDKNLFKIFVLKCTHQDWLLSPNPKGFSCSLHGSTFDLDGKVTNGPATLPLKSLSYNIQENNLIIQTLNQ